MVALVRDCGIVVEVVGVTVFVTVAFVIIVGVLFCGARFIFGVVGVVLVMVGYWRGWWDSGGDGFCRVCSCD